MTYTKEQQIENRKKWVEALRSDKYEQTTGFLKRNNGYCCLGVLCDLAGEEFVPRSSVYAEPGTFEIHLGKDEYGCFHGEALDATQKAMDFVGLRTDIGSFEQVHGDDGEIIGEHTTLADENDAGASFSEIADIIESNPPGLFI